MSEINNNNGDYFEINEIRKSTEEFKIELISNVSRNGIPPDFEKICQSNAEKKFFEIKDGDKHKREWVFFINNRFYCIYCVCFSPLNENRLVKGVEYAKNCRITEKLNSHGKELNHIASKNFYLKTAGNSGKDEEKYQSAKRNAIKCIVKIIVFIATHG